MTGPEFAKALREIADWYDAHPEMPTPPVHTLNVFLDSKEDLAAVARAVGGKLAKNGTGEWYWLRREFSSGWAIEFNVPRDEVCTRRVVGTRHVPEQVTPAHEEEVVEWECSPLLAGDEP